MISPVVFTLWRGDSYPLIEKKKKKKKYTYIRKDTKSNDEIGRKRPSGLLYERESTICIHHTEARLLWCVYRAGRWLCGCMWKVDGRRQQRWQSSTTHKSQVTRRRESLLLLLLLYVHRFNSFCYSLFFCHKSCAESTRFILFCLCYLFFFLGSDWFSWSSATLCVTSAPVLCVWYNKYNTPRF